MVNHSPMNRNKMRLTLARCVRGFSHGWQLGEHNVCGSNTVLLLSNRTC
eukprot:COSAG02_NODE_9285_length_2266_cov_7.374630_3_plen_48_part_01